MSKHKTHHSSLICDLAIAAHQCIACNSLSEHFHTQYVSYYVFCLSVNVSVYKCHVVIANNAVTQGRQALRYALDHNTIRKRIAEMLKFDVCARARHE